jgi:hypothetical protein|tara:strand:+ start:1737 stop:1907 length:171 start_codon:yes stop_codon:yes gene_type:complete
MKTYTMKVAIPFIYEIKARSKEEAEKVAEKEAFDDLVRMIREGHEIDFEVLHKTNK